MRGKREQFEQIAGIGSIAQHQEEKICIRKEQINGTVAYQRLQKLIQKQCRAHLKQREVTMFMQQNRALFKNSDL